MVKFIIQLTSKSLLISKMSADANKTVMGFLLTNSTSESPFSTSFKFTDSKVQFSVQYYTGTALT